MKLFLLLFALKSALGLQLSYNVIEQTGKFCPGRDSCERGRNSRGPIENDWKKRNCFCDNACAMYGDCCIDANAYVQADQQVNHQSFECANLKQYGDIYVKNKCQSDYLNPTIKAKCETPGLPNNDPFGTTPITSMASGFTYKNYYCAVCNEDSEDIRFWRPRLECPTLTSYSNRFKNISSEFVRENLVLSEDGQRWGINIDTSGVTVFHECTVDPAVPDTLTHLIRACTGKNTIDSCPQEYEATENATIVELCASYTAMVFEPNLAYRNVHCAICNNASMDKLICLNLGPFGRFNWQQNFNTFSFAVLFDIGGNAQDSVGFTKKSCTNDFELYDPFFKKCRNVICGQEGMEFRDGRCIETRLPPTEAEETSSLSTPTQSTTTTTLTTTRFAFTTTTTTTLMTTTLSSTSNEAEQTTVFTLFDYENEEENARDKDDNEHDDTNEPITTTTTTRSTFSSVTISSTSTTNNPTTTTTIRYNQDSVREEQSQFQDCPKFELQVGEYKMMDEEHHSVYVEKYDRVLKEGQFAMNGDTLVICVYAENTDSTQYKFGPQMGYVTFVGLGISIICLSMHILASFIAPDLQNLSGKNLCSLSMALLGGYTTFLSTLFVQDIQSTVPCQILALTMYYFFMASFFWMLMIAFDVCRTLKIATTQLRITTGSQWRKFAIYSTLGWGLPLAFTTIVTLMDTMEGIPTDYKPGFGLTALCWFSKKMALLIYFALPFAGIMGVNIFLFVFSACMVFDTTQSTAKMTTSCGPRTNFYLYMRLAIIMGLTWIIGLAAGFVDKEALWYVFIVFNTLQGLFIFVAFTCTRKVFDSLRDCCRSQDPSHRSTWRLSKESSCMVQTVSTKKSQVDMSPTSVKASDSGSAADCSDNNSSPTLVPSRYGSRSKTMYTVSKQQVSGVTQNSFNGRYY